MLTSLIRRARG